MFRLFYVKRVLTFLDKGILQYSYSKRHIELAAGTYCIGSIHHMIERISHITWSFSNIILGLNLQKRRLLYFCLIRPLNKMQITLLQYWSLLNWQNLRLRCGCVAVPMNWHFDIISSFFTKFMNDIHSLEPGETPSNSVSHQALNYVQRS